KRKRDRKDKRIWRVWLTDEGADLINVLPPVVKEIWDKALSGTTENEKERFSQLINLGLKNCCPDYFTHLRELEGDLAGPCKATIPPNSLGYRIKLLSLVLGRLFTERSSEYNVTVSHWIVLCRLWQDDGVSVSEVGGYIEQVGGTLAGVLERMEERGLIERKQADKDKRCWKVWLTPNGASLINFLPPIAKGVLDTFSEGMTEDDLDFFGNFIDKLSTNLSQ
ncbi:MAG: winged helix DNA-binding protein, partial [Candidatus Obscuribacterales bacterium]|nr:winged helix DNA-binding protein [Candidatus Obscuribacterales bacterium]